MPCPRCPRPPTASRDSSTLLVPTRLGDTTVAACARCGGHWLSHAELAEATRDPDAAGRLAALLSPQSVSSPDGTARYLPCPTCGDLMNRRTFGEISGVVVDLCREHGLWFDADELRRAARFVEQGGLARAQVSADRRKASPQRRPRPLPSDDVGEVAATAVTLDVTLTVLDLIWFVLD